MATEAPHLPDYRNLPEAYELEERCRPDEMEMLSAAQCRAACYLKDIENASVLDICCGTGLSFESTILHPNVNLLVGIDISPEYLDFARRRFESVDRPPMLILGDAVTSPLPSISWDVITMASAYHHIEDDRKLAFLNRVRNLLGPKGKGIVAENILPEYDLSKQSYHASVREFYHHVMCTAVEADPLIPDRIKALIERVAQYGYDGDYEYKVSYSVFTKQVREAGLRIISENVSGPKRMP